LSRPTAVRSSHHLSGWSAARCAPSDGGNKNAFIHVGVHKRFLPFGRQNFYTKAKNREISQISKNFHTLWGNKGEIK